jgi:hypothetical protein
LGAQVIDLTASRFQRPGELRGLRGPGIPVGHRDLQIGPQLLKLVIHLHAVVATTDDVERGSHRKQITIID